MVWWNWRRAAPFVGLSKKPTEDRWGFFGVDRIDYYRGLCFFHLTFILHSALHGHRQKSVSKTQKWCDKNSRFWRVGSPNLLFLVTALIFVLDGGHTFRGTDQCNAKCTFGILKCNKCVSCLDFFSKAGPWDLKYQVIWYNPFKYHLNITLGALGD